MEPKRHPGPLSFAMALLLTISPLICGCVHEPEPPRLLMFVDGMEPTAGVDFGNVAYSFSIERTPVIENTGKQSSDWHFAAPHVDNNLTNPDEFWTESDGAATMLVPGHPVHITVRFAPTDGPVYWSGNRRRSNFMISHGGYDSYSFEV